MNLESLVGKPTTISRRAAHFLRREAKSAITNFSMGFGLILCISLTYEAFFKNVTVEIGMRPLYEVVFGLWLWVFENIDTQATAKINAVLYMMYMIVTVSLLGRFVIGFGDIIRAWAERVAKRKPFDSTPEFAVTDASTNRIKGLPHKEIRKGAFELAGIVAEGSFDSTVCTQRQRAAVTTIAGALHEHNLHTYDDYLTILASLEARKHIWQAAPSILFFGALFASGMLVIMSLKTNHTLLQTCSCIINGYHHILMQEVLARFWLAMSMILVLWLVFFITAWNKLQELYKEELRLDIAMYYANAIRNSNEALGSSNEFDYQLFVKKKDEE